MPRAAAPGDNCVELTQTYLIFLGTKIFFPTRGGLAKGEGTLLEILIARKML